MSTQVIMSEGLEPIKQKIKEDGAQNLHVLADFDRTLTYGLVDGVKTPSIISELRNGSYLTEEYAKKAHKLFDMYHPFEVDPNLSLSEKKEKMREWWSAHNKLLVDSGVSKKDLETIAASGRVQFREGVKEFLEYLKKYNVPLIIMSASGCGDAIPMYFEHNGVNYENIHYVINEFEWDEQGKAIGSKKQIIHSFNKDETAITEFPEIYAQVKSRKNVLLLGDSLGDLGMVEGFEYGGLLSIGFLNDKIEENLEVYKKKFDLVITNDSDFSEVNTLAKEILA